MKTGVVALSVCGAVSVLAGSASGQIVPFTAEWRVPGTAVQAVAFFDLDVGAVNALYNPGLYNNGPFAGSPFSNFTLTVTGASAGNGSWVQSDFDSVLLTTSAPLNPLTEWVGQPQLNSVWGDPTPNEQDFNVFARFGSGAPTGVFYFELGLEEGNGQAGLLLTSFRPVPAPGTAMLLGVAGVLGARRRR